MRVIRTLRQFLDAVLVLLVVAVLGLVLASNLGPGLGHQLLVIRGGSMEPAIHLGAVVDVVSATAEQIQPGDVVSMKAENGVIITHRVTRAHLLDGTFFEVKGDANKTPDPILVPYKSLMGRVAFSVPYLGYLMYMLTIPTGILSVFLLAGTLLLAIWLLEDLEEAEEEDAEEEAAGRGDGTAKAGEPVMAAASPAGEAGQ